MALERIGNLMDELDREVRTLETARSLARTPVSPERAALAVRGLRHLLAAETEEAAQVFEALAEELRERTLPL